MVPEELIITRDGVECIVAALRQALETKEHYQFKLRVSGQSADGKRTLTIVPHCEPIEIALERS